MKLNDRQFAAKVFADYYREAEFSIPKIEKREFGIGNIKKIDSRHLCFANVSEFRNYLCNNTPFFVSHSTAYYEFPGATPIQKKIWTAADIVFDLDIHAEGKYGAYPKLEPLKQELIRLVDDFIVNDFGISRNDIAAVFSGNRGYHVHIRDKNFIKLGGEERRELVEYVMGLGLNYRDFFAPSDSKPPKLLGPSAEEGGYRGRLARSTIKLVRENPSALSRIFNDEKKREFFISGINEGNWSKTSLKLSDLLSRLEPIAKELSVNSIDTDAAVTHDLSKLIRVPNSIHGESGFIAKIVAGPIESFDPLRDALIPNKDGRELKVQFTEDVPVVAVGGSPIGPFKKDELQTFQLPIGLFFVLKGSATIAD
ncbi:DNA primase catalytic subunit PriS [Candidatus Micrarchaeota archaeon]|nr:DNA primase catalytic subunit PriS [Candidatus Micrarchaeota archaeon]